MIIRLGAKLHKQLFHFAAVRGVAVGPTALLPQIRRIAGSPTYLNTMQPHGSIPLAKYWVEIDLRLLKIVQPFLYIWIHSSSLVRSS